MNNAIVSIQILPSAPTQAIAHARVDKAIACIQQSGFLYKVGALETTIEGELGALLQLIQRIHETMIEAGAPYVLGQVKVYYNPTDGASMQRFTQKYDS